MMKWILALALLVVSAPAFAQAPEKAKSVQISAHYTGDTFSYVVLWPYDTNDYIYRAVFGPGAGDVSLSTDPSKLLKKTNKDQEVFEGVAPAMGGAWLPMVITKITTAHDAYVKAHPAPAPPPPAKHVEEAPQTPDGKDIKPSKRSETDEVA